MNILIADDEPIERLVITKKIQKYFGNRLTVTAVENGEDAVISFRKTPFEIVLLDICMPGIDGLTAAEQIRAISQTCCIIFLTAFDDFNYAKKAFSVKALDYLLKPGSDEELITVLEEAIRLTEAENFKSSDGFSSMKESVSSANTMENDITKSIDNGRIRAVTDSIRLYIDEHYAEDISLQDVAHTMGYSDAHFCKIFKQCFGTTFTAYLMDYRINMAKSLLADALINIKDIGLRVGFHDSTYFTRVFKRVTGMTPSEYRNEILNKHFSKI